MSQHIVDGKRLTYAEWIALHDRIARDDHQPFRDFRPSDRFVGCPEDLDGDDLPALLRRQAE